MTEPCPACSLPLPASARFCAACGTAVDSSATPTGTAPRGRVSGTPPAAPTSGSPGAPGSSRPRSTAGFSGWKATPTLMAFAVVIALAIYGFRAATAGRPLLGDRIS